MPSIKIVNLSFIYPDDSVIILEDINVEINSGEFVCILGQSGCGKSTLLRLLAGLEKPATGEITVNSKPINGASLDRGVVFQDYGLFPWLTAGENIKLALEQKFKNRPKKEYKERTLHAFESGRT